MKTALVLCGVTTPELLGEIPEGGAAGFVLGIPGNPRSLPAPSASALIERLPNGVEAWGLVRDPSVDFVRQLYEEVGLDRIVVYGRIPEGLEFLEIHHLLPSLPVPGAGSGGEAPVVPPAEDYARLHLDAAGTALEQGSPDRPDWEICARLVDAHPGRKFTLAGGLTPENVAEALAAIRPWGVSFGAAIESAPGQTDPVRFRAALRAIEQFEAARTG
ncbi:MAG: phosphoribosylanthranilate isomerase [Thermoplasmata archaeon]